MSEPPTTNVDASCDIGESVSSTNGLLEQPPADPYQDFNVFKTAVLVEGGMAVLALLIGYFGFYDHTQPLGSFGIETWQTGIIWGVWGTVPLLVYLAVFHFKPPRFLQPMKDFVEKEMKPLFKRSSLLELLVVSLLAGFCEEIFFRWCIQGGIASAIGTPWGSVIALVVVSILFGCCHWVNASYGITTTFVGLYLGVLMIWTGSFLAPAIAHALFDFIALIYVQKLPSKPERSPSPRDVSSGAESQSEGLSQTTNDSH